MKMSGFTKIKKRNSTETESPSKKENILINENDKAKKTSFFPTVVQNGLTFSFDSFHNHFSDSVNPGSKASMSLNSSLFSQLGQSNGTTVELFWPAEIEKIRKVNSAKKMLKDLSRHYESIFKGQDYENHIPEKEIFLHSNILYLIAATDGNEDTLGHSQLVASYTLLLTKALGIEDKNYLVNIERGALLHDIGKIGIPESILRKPGPLTALEKEIVKEHPLIGYDLIEEFEFLKKAAKVVLFHHENYNGNGYPYALAKDEIPLEARIFAVADTLDAITSDRPYRKGSNFDVAFCEIERGRGTQFDPDVVDTLFSVPPEKWEKIKENTEESLLLHTSH